MAVTGNLIDGMQVMLEGRPLAEADAQLRTLLEDLDAERIKCEPRIRSASDYFTLAVGSAGFRPCRELDTQFPSAHRAALHVANLFCEARLADDARRRLLELMGNLWLQKWNLGSSLEFELAAALLQTAKSERGALTREQVIHEARRAAEQTIKTEKLRAYQPQDRDLAHREGYFTNREAAQILQKLEGSGSEAKVARLRKHHRLVPVYRGTRPSGVLTSSLKAYLVEIGIEGDPDELIDGIRLPL